MSTKPSAVATWDSSLTHVVPTTGGHQTSGLAVNEVPGSGEFNYWMNLCGQWTIFENALLTNGGGATGQLDIGNAAEATVTPLDLRRDYIGNRRALIDHNGYRMGQVTEKDECWDVGAVTIAVPICDGQSANGAAPWTFNGTSWFCNTAGSSNSLNIPADGLMPPGSVITNVTVTFAKTLATDTLAMFFFPVTNAVTGTGCQKSSTTVSGRQTVDIMTGATTGHGPLLYDSTVDEWVLNFTGTITSGQSITISACHITYIPPPVGWAWSSTTANNNQSTPTVGDQFTVVDPQSGLNQRAAQLFGTAVNAVAGASVLNPGWETYHDANCAYAIEFMCKTGVITDGSAHRLFMLGVQNNNGGAANRFVSLYTDNTFANWQLQVVGSATSNTDTGVAVAASTVYRVRLEIYGSSVNSSGSTKVRAYINGTKVAEVNVATLPAADKIRPYFKVATNGTTGGPYDVTIGRVRRAWNHLLAGDNL